MEKINEHRESVVRDMTDIRTINLMFVAFKSLHIHANRKEYLLKKMRVFISD
jgi:hypothetical protein